MPVGLLDSQFATLEEPGPDERPIVVDVGGTAEQIVAEILRQLGGARIRST
jgi:gluconate kinase